MFKHDELNYVNVIFNNINADNENKVNVDYRHIIVDS